MKKKAAHHISHAEEVKGGEHSHMHHKKAIMHHLSELHKMAKKAVKSKKHKAS